MTGWWRILSWRSLQWYSLQWCSLQWCSLQWCSVRWCSLRWCSNCGHVLIAGGLGPQGLSTLTRLPLENPGCRGSSRPGGVSRPLFPLDKLLDLCAKVRRHIDPRRVLVVADVNAALHLKDQKKQRPTDTIYRHTCSNLGLVDLGRLVDVPDGTWSCVEGQGSRIDTAALTLESSLQISQAYYWPSTLLSDHHYPLLLIAHVPAVGIAKRRKTSNARLPEAHMTPVHLAVNQQFQYATEVHKQDRGELVRDSYSFTRRLQMAMYKWAAERNYVKVQRFDKGELERRPDEETKDVIGGQPMEHPDEMLPTVSEFLTDLRKEIGDLRASENVVKTKMIQLTMPVPMRRGPTSEAPPDACPGGAQDLLGSEA